MNCLDKRPIVIMGGTFNPIHLGHMQMMECAKDYVGDCEILVIPNKTTYYKEQKDTVSDDDRMAMLKLAVEDKPDYEISDMEIVRGGVTHSIDTIRELKTLYPKRKLYFIIGGDSLLHLSTWVEAGELMRLTTFLTVVRDDIDQTESKRIIEEYKKTYEKVDIQLLNMKAVDISSSEIRSLVKSGKSIKRLVPTGVAEYIEKNKLYIK